jgi:hypothetical protein
MTVLALLQPSGKVYHNIGCVVDQTVSTDTFPPRRTPPPLTSSQPPFPDHAVIWEIPQSDDHQLEPPSSDIGEFKTISPYTIGLLVFGPNGRDTPD